MSTVPRYLRGLVDDAAIFPPGCAELSQAVTDHGGYRRSWYADMVGPLVVRDTDLAEVARLVERVETTPNLGVVVSGGAGALASGARLAHRLGQHVAQYEIAVRDLDDPAGNARRVVAAYDTAAADDLVADETHVYVELPQADVSANWLAAADVVAEAGHRLKFRTGGLDADLVPSPARLAGWLEAALDREASFKCTAGLHHPVRHRDDALGAWQHGFLNVLLATHATLDGADVGSVERVLSEHDPGVLLADLRGLGDDALVSARRWFASYGSCSVHEPLDDLIDLDLMEGPR